MAVRLQFTSIHLMFLLLCSALLATTLQGVQGEVDVEGPSESECRPYIEKALKKLETGDAQSAEVQDDIAHIVTTDDSETQGDSLEITDAETSKSAEEETQEVDAKSVEEEGQSKEQDASTETGDTQEISAEEKDVSEDSAVDGATEEVADESAEAVQDEASAEKDTQETQSEEKQDEIDEQTSVEESTAEQASVEETTAEPASKEEVDEGSVEQDGSVEKEASVEEVTEQAQSAEDEGSVEQEASQEQADESKGEESAEQTADSAEQVEGSVEQKEESGEQKEESGEQKEESGEQKEESGEQKEESGEQKEESGEQKEESREQKEESGEQKDESVEQHDESAEQKEESGEQKEESAEQAAESLEQAAESVEQAAESTEKAAESVEQADGSVEQATESLEQTVESAEQAEGSVEQKEESGEQKEESTEQKEDSAEQKEVSAEKVEDEASQEQNASAEKEESADKQDASSAEATEDKESIEKQESDEQTVEVESAEGKVTDEASTEVEAEKESAEQEQADEAASTEQPTESEPTPEEDLTWEIEIPTDLRPRDHVNEILHLNDETSETDHLLLKAADNTLKELKRIYENAIHPLETLYKYRDLSNRHFGDPEIFSKPLVLFMGPWSGGKSSIINYLLDNEYTQNSLRTGAEPSPAYFNLLMWGEKPEVLDGTQLAADWTFSGLQKFGQGLEERLRGLKLPNKLLEKINIAEIPGILEVRKQVSRVFPFNDACQWFIDRADIIFLVYDPSKLDVGPETEAILDQLKGREYQTRIILNKADQVKPEELMRVQGALIWNISPLMSSAQPPVMYSTSLWSKPYEIGAPIRLLHAQEIAFLRDLKSAIDKRIDNKIASARRFAVRVRNHAKMVDCYLTTYYNHKSVFGNKKIVADQIIEHPQDYHIYEGLSTLTNISRYDLPDPDVYRDFFRLNPLYDFQQLSATCTYFRGCPINRLDIAIAYDLPELVGKYKKTVETIQAGSNTDSSTKS